MAHLQLAPCPHVDIMFPFNKMEASELHSSRQTPYEQSSSTHQSRLEHLKNNFQQKLLRDKEEKLESIFTHNRQNTFTKAHSYPSSHSTESSQQDSGSNLQGPGSGDFYSVGVHIRHTKTENQENTTPFTKKRAGVDRAYPLKPVFHRKSLSATHIRIGSRNFSQKPPESKKVSPSHFSSRNRGNSSSAKMLLAPLAVAQPKKFLSNPDRTELMQIQKLEAAGESLEEEIWRKETLLREKLKKTEEELRRIQREKEQVEEEEKKELQRKTFPRRRGTGNGSSISRLIFSPEFRSEEVFNSYSRGEETWEQSQENSSSSSVSSQFFNHGVQRLKKERLVASNNKIRDQISVSSPEPFLQHQQDPGNSLPKSPSYSSFQVSVSSGSSSTEEPELGECSYCGRKFLLLRLEKHTNVCSKTQGSKRKVFDSSKARAKGTELEQYLTWKGPSLAKPEPPKKSNWRQKHESFIRTLRQAREVQQVIARGGNPSDLPPMLPAENPDYIQCPHCSRHFAPKVADRHIPKCKTIKNRPPPPRKRCC
ncbi:zinc finger C2HC domain-containing protein 1C [Trichosurus vulpecula]|uniref:zinc finger C2HC domain-containing protein 1C n=1 Tax=Trichosurus vulpecula TaxID=9337 RepID=UPI00186B0B54|nr:zinc finger C2HC domain-containing protein 1C [Trichosurus vulpecula]